VALRRHLWREECPDLGNENSKKRRQKQGRQQRPHKMVLLGLRSVDQEDESTGKKNENFYWYEF